MVPGKFWKDLLSLKNLSLYLVLYEPSVREDFNTQVNSRRRIFFCLQTGYGINKDDIQTLQNFYK